MSTDTSPELTPPGDPAGPPGPAHVDGAPTGLALAVRNIFTAENGALDRKSVV